MGNRQPIGNCGSDPSKCLHDWHRPNLRQSDLLLVRVAQCANHRWSSAGLPFFHSMDGPDAGPYVSLTTSDLGANDTTISLSGEPGATDNSYLQDANAGDIFQFQDTYENVGIVAKL